MLTLTDHWARQMLHAWPPIGRRVQDVAPSVEAGKSQVAAWRHAALTFGLLDAVSKVDRRPLAH